MKLTSAQVERTLSQFEGQAIPDNHPVISQLSNLFGDHTFFLNNDGLNIVEPAPEFRRRRGSSILRTGVMKISLS